MRGEGVHVRIVGGEVVSMSVGAHYTTRQIKMYAYVVATYTDAFAYD